jgi:hypothetical protein
LLDFWRVNIEMIVAVQDYVTPDDYEHMKWISLDGCPAQLTFKEPSSNKLEFYAQGNSTTFVDNLQLVQKTMNRKNRYSHLVLMDQWKILKVSPFGPPYHFGTTKN